MKKTIAIASLALLFILALTVTQAFAFAPTAPSSPAKKTPLAGQQAGQSNPQSGDKDTRATARADDKATRVSDKVTQEAFRDDRKATQQAEKDLRKGGAHVNYRGVISGIAADKLDLTLKDGGSVSVTMDSNTIVRIPTMGDAGSQTGLKVGMNVVVHALKQAQGDPLALSINVIPGKPTHFHRVGVVTAYTQGVSITILGKDGTPVTFTLTTNTKVLPSADFVPVLNQTVVTIVSARNVTGPDIIVQALVFHSATD
ncbi:MAG TPA: hypothetical protein VF806_01015 [Anaerolineaceae bacterium]